jgi:hypothetical protein
MVINKGHLTFTNFTVETVLLGGIGFDRVIQKSNNVLNYRMGQ